MNGFGKIVRHLIGAGVGGAVGAIVAFLAGHGVEVDPDVAADLTVHITNALVLASTVGGYAIVEKLLKRFRWLDVEGWIDREALKVESYRLEAGAPPPLSR